MFVLLVSNFSTVQSFTCLPFSKQTLGFICLSVHFFLKHCKKRRNCSSRAISLFLTIFSTVLETFLQFLLNLELWSANTFSLEESNLKGICRRLLASKFYFRKCVKLVWSIRNCIWCLLPNKCPFLLFTQCPIFFENQIPPFSLNLICHAFNICQVWNFVNQVRENS